jgi:hypothetical protein
MPRTVTVIPSARRLMDSLRDIGYELPAAVADLIDNSIDADATRVDVTVEFEGENSWIHIADNGGGMETARMNEAMRYGSEREYDEPDLGKFGLGLKTASLSQCRRLTVATRTNPARRSIEIRCWDLDHVIEEDRWDLLRLTTYEVRPELVEPLDDGVGAVVMWERLDRVLAYRLPSGRAAETGLGALCREIESHLGMVFHRFLSGEAHRALPLTITVNGNPVDAWDPYARSQSATVPLPKQTLSLRHEGADRQITVEPFILPNQMQFSTVTEWERAGRKNWNRQQGFYIYRGDRLIQAGGWNRLRTSDEHTKLARVAIDLPRSADTAFEINVSKMRVTIPSDIRDQLKAIASAVANRAQAAYRRSGGSSGSGNAGRGGSISDVPSRDSGRGARGGDDPGSSDVGVDRASSNGTISLQVVEQVVMRELADHPELRGRVLQALQREINGSHA